MTPQQARARMKALKNPNQTHAKRLAKAKIQAKADTRARLLIERAQAGESHTAIAQALGLARCTVSQAISRYRRRHLIEVNSHDPAHTGIPA